MRIAYALYIIVLVCLFLFLDYGTQLKHDDTLGAMTIGD